MDEFQDRRPSLSCGGFVKLLWFPSGCFVEKVDDPFCKVFEGECLLLINSSTLNEFVVVLHAMNVAMTTISMTFADVASDERDVPKNLCE